MAPFNTATPDRSNRFGRRDSREDRKARSKSPSRSRSKSIDAPRGPAAPSGPRSTFPQRNPDFFAGPRPPFRPRPFNSLPAGWFPATDENGRTYYYDASGKTTWQRPTMAAAPPPPPPKPTSTNKALEDIINEITNAKANTPKEKQLLSSTAPVINGEGRKEGKGGTEKWRTYSEEKQKKLYENTLFPHIRHVMDKFKGKLSRDDLKRFAKEISKKLVNSDYKNHRVEDPTKISSRQEKQVKKYVHEYFEKAVAKKKEHDKKKVGKKAEAEESDIPRNLAPTPSMRKEEESDDGQDVALSEDEDEKPKQECATPVTPMDQLLIAEGLKRKRGTDDTLNGISKDDEGSIPSKRLKSESPPPPPPPPPINDWPLYTQEHSDLQAGFEGTSQLLTGPYDNGASDDIPMNDSPNLTDRPAPPPPPTDIGNVGTADIPNVSIPNGVDTARETQAPNQDVPDAQMVDEETMKKHEQHFPAHGHRHEVSVHGGA